MKKFFTLILISSLISSGCATSSSRNGVSFFDEEQMIGEKIHSQILSSFKVYRDPILKDYIRSVGDSITQQAERRLPYRFTILHHDKIYATSAPGGYVYLTTGFIRFLESEAEVAAVIAHEVARLQSTHPKADRRKRLANTAVKGVAFVAPLFGPFGILALLGVMASDIVLQATGPESKLNLKKLDKKAMKYMIKAGYDPQGYIDMMRKIFHAHNDLQPYLQEYNQSRGIDPERMAHGLKHFSGLDLLDKQLVTQPQAFQEAKGSINLFAG